MNETKTEWRDCADPDELAAAVAAGVEVRWAKPGWSSGEWALSTASSPANFAGAMRRGNRYSVPTSWTWSPEPPATGAERYLAGRMADPEYRAAYEATSPPAPDDLRERLRLGIEDAVNDYADVVMDIMDAEVVRHAGWLAARLEEADAERTTLRHRLVETAPTPPPAPPCDDDENDDIARLSPDQGDRIVDACCRMLGCEPADIDGDAAYEEILTEAVERCADLHGQDRWEDDCHGCGFRVGDHTTDGRCPPAPSPVPPWPGAVLSGLVDEDGVPTWLAQAGQVRGEQVRIWHDEPWVTTHGSWADSRWVEVRAPRAVPEPETERVKLWEAFGRKLPDGRVICGWQWSTQTRDGSVTHDDGTFTPVHDAPTVEVLKDGDR